MTELTLFVIVISFSILVQEIHANSLSQPELSDSGTAMSKSASTDLEGVNFGIVEPVLTLANQEPHVTWKKAAAATSVRVETKNSSQRYRRVLENRSQPGPNPPPEDEDPPKNG